MPKLKGACIGAGYFSHFQYEAWQRIPEVELVAFSNRDPVKAAAVSERFGLSRLYVDYREMLDKEKPDFVDVITPPPSHAEICREAARRGIHVICQKPLAPTWQEARDIVENAARAGIRFMVHENFRFQPWHRQLKHLLEDGAIGIQLHSLTFRSRMGDGWGQHAYIPRQPYFREYPKLLVYETGVHFIDTFRYLAGEIERVSAWLRRLNPVIKGEDCGLLIFEFTGGALGQWDANRFNEPNYPNSRYTFGEFLLEGEQGSLRLFPDGRITLQLLGRPEQTVDYLHENRGFAGDCCYFTQRHFVDRLLDGQPFETSGEDYLKTLAVQEAVYCSAQERRPVEVIAHSAQPGRPAGRPALSAIGNLTGLDHLAIAVSDTEEALRVWRDRFGFQVACCEDVNGGTVRLTQLELGNAQLQLVQPLTPDHPLQQWLAQHGGGLHHLCLRVTDVAEALASSPVAAAAPMHQGTRGKRAVFLDRTATQGVLVELTGE